MSRSTKSSNKNNYWTLTYLDFIFDTKFDPIKSYLDHSEQMIDLHRKELEIKYDKWEKENTNNPDMPSAFDRYENEMINNAEFSNILHNSIFLSIYSVFENEFLNLCLYCQKDENLKLGPNDLNGRNYLGQCRKYIEKVINVNIDNLEGEWQTLQNYQVLRNCIAHKQGQIINPDHNLLNFINRNPNISIDSSKNLLVIESIEFLKQLIDLVIKFLLGIAGAVINQKEAQPF